MEQKLPARKIIKRLKRVWDSCETSKQREVAKEYIRLALLRYDWFNYYSKGIDFSSYFFIRWLNDNASISKIRKENDNAAD